MDCKKVFGFCLVVLFSLFTSACFTIEKEVFLNADGSGELVLHVSMPDLPEASKGDGASKNPFSEFEKFKRDIMTRLPATVKLKEAKQVKQNGVMNFYAVMEFKDLKDTEKIFENFAENESGTGISPEEFQWTSAVEKQAGKSTFRERFYFDVSKMSEAKAGATAEVKNAPPPQGRTKGATTKRGSRAPGAAGQSQATASAEVKIEGMEQLESLMLSLIRLRFVIHTPTPITESNADIVLGNNRIAVWNCSLLNFSKDKKPIELKATY